MDHIAIDLGGRESQICVRDEAGTILEEKRHPTKELRAYLSKRAKSRVVMETCAEGFYTADQALELGHEVRVVPADGSGKSAAFRSGKSAAPKKERRGR
jgi:predicted NBD/HSP70 family sugar kinase